MAVPSPAKVVVARVVLLAAVVAGLIVALVVHGRGREPIAARAGLSEASFSCPMHEQVVAPVPGECPICRMALEPLRSVAAVGGATFSLRPGTPRLTEQDVALAKRKRVGGQITAPARVDAERSGIVVLYGGEAAAGQRARFYPAAGADAAGVDVQITGDPPQREDGGVVTMRFELARGAPGFVPRQTGWIVFERAAVDTVTVPHAAVFETSDGTFVFLASANGRTFTRRKLELGRTHFGHAVVLSGLNDGERVAVSKAFSLAAEQARLRDAAQPRAGATP